MAGKEQTLEDGLASILQFGTYLSAGIIAIGWLGSAALGVTTGNLIINIGIFVLLMLPIIRLSVMCFAYFKQKNFALSGVALVVLAIIGLSIICGILKNSKL